MRSQRIVITLICDHCPPDASAEVTEVRTVGYGAGKYEIDLCAEHAVALDKSMAGITGGTRRLGRESKSGTGGKDGRKFRDDAREWAMANGKHVNRTGIIPAATLAEYRESLRNRAV